MWGCSKKCQGAEDARSAGQPVYRGLAGQRVRGQQGSVQGVSRAEDRGQLGRKQELSGQKTGVSRVEDRNWHSRGEESAGQCTGSAGQGSVWQRRRVTRAVYRCQQEGGQGVSRAEYRGSAGWRTGSW